MAKSQSAVFVSCSHPAVVNLLPKESITIEIQSQARKANQTQGKAPPTPQSKKSVPCFPQGLDQKTDHDKQNGDEAAETANVEVQRQDRTDQKNGEEPRQEKETIRFVEAQKTAGYAPGQQYSTHWVQHRLTPGQQDSTHRV